MNEEQKKLQKLLEEKDKFFRQKGLYEEVNAFLESEQVKDRINLATEDLIVQMKKMEKSAPDANVKLAANRLRNEFEQNKECIAEDVIASFKVNFAESIEMVLHLTDDVKAQSLIIKMAKESIQVKGIEDINDICSAMVERNSHKFMMQIYRNFVPEGMPESVAAFIQMLCGVEAMIPFSVFSSEE